MSAFSPVLPFAEPDAASHSVGAISKPVEKAVFSPSTLMRPSIGHLPDFFILLVLM
jgi:hypothetical protein